MFTKRVKIDKELLRQAKRYADMAGYSSVEEFVAHALETQLRQFEEAETEEEVRDRLRGLGYIS